MLDTRLSSEISSIAYRLLKFENRDKNQFTEGTISEVVHATAQLVLRNKGYIYRDEIDKIVIDLYRQCGFSMASTHQWITGKGY